MERWAIPNIRTTVLISPEFYKACKESHIRFSEAMRVGISLMLAELGLKEYDNELNILRKMQLIQSKLSETSQELNTLKEKHAKQELSKGKKKGI